MVATKATEAASVAASLFCWHTLLPRKQAIWQVPPVAKELPTIVVTAEKQQQTKHLHKQKPVAGQPL